MVETERKPQFWQGLAVLAFVCAANWFLLSRAQAAWGLYGMALTELFIAAAAVVAAKLFGVSFKELLPLKRVGGRKIAGSLFLWLGVFLIVDGISLIMMLLFPDMAEVTDGIASFIGQDALWLRLAAVALLPGICEELLHRGFIVNTIGNIGRDWVRVIYMGALFGIFHMEPYRFLPTALLGGMLTYVLIRTGNILVPMCIHALHNSLSVLAGTVTETADTAETLQSVDWSAGIMLIGLGLVPAVVGLIMLRHRDNKLSAVWVAAGFILSFALFFGGVIMSGIALLTAPVFEHSVSDGEISSERLTFSVTVASPDYAYSGSVDCENRVVTMNVLDGDGKFVKELTSGGDAYAFSGNLPLNAGTYTFEYIIEPVAGAPPQGGAEFSVVIRPTVLTYSPQG
ncbi:hypothetical protein FACS18949_07890 [Clostridia bacterium]|nr:hypothetical protein FACS18949_07890 [Clostridia bacterium]